MFCFTWHILGPFRPNTGYQWKSQTVRINCCFLEKSTVKPKLSVFHSHLRCTTGRKQTAFIGRHAQDSTGKRIILFLYTILWGTVHLWKSISSQSWPGLWVLAAHKSSQKCLRMQLKSTRQQHISTAIYIRLSYLKYREKMFSVCPPY